MSFLKSIRLFSILLIFSFCQIGATCFATTTLGNASTTSALFTWINGSNVTGQAGVYGTQGVASPDNVPGNRAYSISWKDASGNFWLFGGQDQKSGAFLNDLWKYDINTKEWTWMNGSNKPNQFGVYSGPDFVPGARYLSMSWRDSSGNFWLFGGYGYASSNGGSIGDLNDLWMYNPNTNKWAFVSSNYNSDQANQPGYYGTKGVASPSNRPGARSSGVTWIDSSNNLWLFGGDRSLNDLWKYDTTAKVWTWMSGSDTPAQRGSYGTKGVASPNNVPGARHDAISWTDSSGNFWLFGGYGWPADYYQGFPYALNDLWKYDPSTNEWTWMSGSDNIEQPGVYGTQGVASTDNVPGARFYSISWIDSTGNLWLFGGVGFATATDNSGARLNDLWMYNPNTNEWTWVSGSNKTNEPGSYGTQGIASPNNIPGARNGSVTWIDASGNLWLFGGSASGINSVSGGFNDLWKINTTATTP